MSPPAGDGPGTPQNRAYTPPARPLPSACPLAPLELRTRVRARLQGSQMWVRTAVTDLEARRAEEGKGAHMRKRALARVKEALDA
jgi:hypothetical protein